ncbi:histidine kinase [Murimonas intestini]|uniref:histidine kinase n=1 Tax=Murimonas intestini TaxID=1337051 RepID=A0AB73T7B4_9FIRM|nr:histidine kinase [Murimonas intestini]MCR1841281.1 sensor histidine kinase [Murimonas intestini]MCR1866199.1 sensor histidine kinase [Murimonas intestini]MCR1882684.1 sensor histidine kinase [Murimonas intestini]
MHLIRHYMNQPIRKKLLLFLISSLSLIGITIFSALLFIYKDFSHQTVTMTSKTLDLYTRQLDDSLSQLAGYSLNLIFDSAVQDNLVNLSSTKDSYELLMIKNRLNEKLFLSASSLDYMDHADIITPGNQFLSSASGRITKPGQTYEELQHIIREKGRCVWEISPSGQSSGQLVMSRLIQTINNNFTYEPLGILSFYIDVDVLTDLENFSKNYYKSFFFITGPSGEILYRPGNAEELNTVTSVGSSIYQDFNDTAYFVTTQPSSVAGWSYCLLLPKSEILGRIVTITVSLILIFIFLIFLCILTSFCLSRRITLPLFHLSREMDSVASGNFQIREDELLDSTADDELRSICLHFIQMTDQLDTLITENYAVKLLNKDAQLRALQAQIDPHFLYNTLDSVNWLAKLAGQKDISTIVQSLAALMRQTMSAGNEGYTLGDELKLLENYLSIQQIRYGERLHFSNSIDDKMLSLPVPKLILQPLIENSIKYALENMDKTCEILLEVKPYKPDCCRIRILDNGPGILPETVPLILSGQLKPRGSGVGLKNVSDRLKLLYSMDEPLQITTDEQGGTCITILIPLEGGFQCQ